MDSEHIASVLLKDLLEEVLFDYGGVQVTERTSLELLLFPQTL